MNKIWNSLYNRLLLFCSVALLSGHNILATNYYVATNGSDSNNGTSISTPFLSVHYAVSKMLNAGDTIFVRAGTHSYNARLNLSSSGTSASVRRVICSYPGDERPILDFSPMAIGSTNQGVQLTGSYWYIKGIRIKGAGDNGLLLDGGGNNIIEYCDFFENRDGGFQMKNGAHDNRVINCDSYYNADYVEGSTTYVGGNADGFSPKLDCGTGNYYYGCRAWLNSDDGWDGLRTSNVEITTTLENCWTWKNGYLKDGTTTSSDMNGNGFKTGGGWTVLSDGTKNYDKPHNQILHNCLAFYNKSKGFDQNHNQGSVTMFNCTSKGNLGQNFYFSGTIATGKIITVKNSISFEGNSKVSLISTADTAMNSWKKSGFTSTITASNFVSIDTAGISAPRKADGSLPDVGFMHLATGSALIDAGIDVGLPYSSTKPDLGCFETQADYILTTNVTGNGTISPTGANSYSAGTAVSITATPALGYNFTNFTSGGVIVSTSNPYLVPMNTSRTITANFVLKQHTVTSSATTGGTITASSTVNYGTNVILTATAATGYKFLNFTSGSAILGANNPITIVVKSDTAIQANFELKQFNLTTQTGAGTGTISPSGTNAHNYGSEISISATAETGFRFLNFTSGTTIISTTNPLSVTLISDSTITANFTSSAYILTTSIGLGSGTISPAGANGYNNGSIVSITATPSSKFSFLNFTSKGIVLGTTNPMDITIHGDSSIVANFEQYQYTLTTATGSGSGSVSPEGNSNIAIGSSVSITAIPAAGYRFVNFTKGGVEISTKNPYTVVMDADKIITANFELDQYALTTNVGTGTGTVSPTGTKDYNNGSEVTITATPGSGYVFANFTSGTDTLSSTNPFTITMDADKTVTANFETPKYTLTTSILGGEGTITPSGVTKYSPGTVVAIAAAAASGFKFVSFTLGSVILSRNTPMNVTMDASKTIVAIFTSATSTTNLSSTDLTCTFAKNNGNVIVMVNSPFVASTKAEVFDILGKKVWNSETKNGSTQIEFDIPQHVLRSSIYYCRITSGQKTCLLKLPLTGN